MSERQQMGIGRAIAIGAMSTAVAGTAAAAAVLTLGWIDVAADVPHARAVHSVIEFARERSIARRSREVVPPPDLADAERIRRGAGNYDAMCVDCHLAPGVAQTEIRRGLYPQPPELAKATAAGSSPERAAARSFWIVKHGIKATGMPAWANGGMDDAAIWDLVAFVGVLPTLSPQQYRNEVKASDGHAHGGMEGAHPHEKAAKEDSDSHRNDAVLHGHDHSAHGH